MNSINYIGNCSSIINWSDIINQIKDQEPGYVGPRQNWDDPEIKFIADVWKAAGYKPVREGGSAEWSMYFPEQHFSIDVVEQFAIFAGMKSWNSAWISKVLPGHCAPWHVDLQVPNKCKPDRIHCHIDTPDSGHILIIDDQHILNPKQGDTYRWTDTKLWHAASNIGKKPNYLFNIY